MISEPKHRELLPPPYSERHREWSKLRYGYFRRIEMEPIRPTTKSHLSHPVTRYFAQKPWYLQRNPAKGRNPAHAK